MRDRSHDDAMAEIFRKDPDYAVDTLNCILEGGDPGELLIALRHMTLAFGGVSRIADQARLNRTQLYRTLSKDGNPEVRSLIAILRTMGLQLAVRPIRGVNRSMYGRRTSRAAQRIVKD